MKIGDRIRLRRKELNLSVDYIANKLDKNRATIYRYENGDIDNLPISILKPIAKILHTTPSYLIGWENDTTDNLSQKECIKMLPLISDEITHNQPLYTNCKYRLYTKMNADFCLKVKDNSMINARIHYGDIVFIKKMRKVRNGEIAAVTIKNIITLKRVYFDKKNSILILSTDNPKHNQQIFTEKKICQVHIIGKAVGFQSTL